MKVVFEALIQHAQFRPDGTAFIFQQDLRTYRRLARETERVVRGPCSERRQSRRSRRAAYDCPKCSSPITRASGWALQLNDRDL